jgi:hypothetical protein
MGRIEKIDPEVDGSTNQGNRLGFRIACLLAETAGTTRPQTGNTDP